MDLIESGLEATSYAELVDWLALSSDSAERTQLDLPVALRDHLFECAAEE